MSIFRSLLLLILMLSFTFPALAFGNFEYAESDTGYRRKREKRRFDFEEGRGATPNFGELPRDWHIIGRRPETNDERFEKIQLHSQLLRMPGYTIHSKVQFDPVQGVQSQNHSLYLKSNRDNVGAFLAVGAVAVVPGSDHQIDFRVKTRGLKRSYGKIRIYYIDREKKRIINSEVASPQIKTNGQWQEYSLKLSGEFSGATYIGIQLELNQPVFDDKNPLGKHQLILKDLQGEAWFDDIVIWQLPNVDVKTQSDVNIIRMPETPMLTINVRDLSGNPMRAVVKIYDADMNLVDFREEPVGDGAPSTWKWEPPNIKKFGWYMVDMSIYGLKTINQAPLARTIRTFLWLDKGQPLVTRETDRFKLILEDISNSSMPLIPEFADQSQISSFYVSAWTPETTITNMPIRQKNLSDLFRGLTRSGRSAAISLYPMPSELISKARRLENDVIGVFSKDINTWVPYVTPVINHQGQNVANWQIGSIDFAEDVKSASQPDLIRKFADDFTNLAPHPSLVLPWSIIEPKDDLGKLDVSYHLDLSAKTPPDQIKELLKDWQYKPGFNTQLHLNVLDARLFSHVDRGVDLALRMLYAWESDIDSITIDKPFVVVGSKNLRIIPDAVLGVYSTVSQHLASRKFVAWLKIKPGIKTMVFDGAGTGMMAIWAEDASEKDRFVELYLGEEIRATDIYGNKIPVSLVNGRHRIEIGDSPVFVKGIDTKLAIYRSRFKMTNPFILSHQEPHDRTIEIYNPWNRTISGSLRITDPSRWTISPSKADFFIAAGETYRLPIKIRFPRNETAGKKHLSAMVDFIAKIQYKIKLDTEVEIGLEDVEVDANLTRLKSKNGGIDDAVTVLNVTNKSEKSISMYAFASLTGFQSLKKTIQNLKPGQTVTKIFRFKNAADVVMNNSIRTGVHEISGPAMLMKRVTFATEE